MINNLINMIVMDNKQKNLFDSLLPLKMQKLKKELKKIDEILERKIEIMETVKKAFLKNNENARYKGQKGYCLVTKFRCVLLKHMYGLSFMKTANRLESDLQWRLFTKTYFGKTPDVSRIKRWKKKISSEVLENIHKKILDYCREDKIIKGKKLRSDTTVTETNIHYPTDSNLLSDGIRKICSTMKQMKEHGINMGKSGRNFGRVVKKHVLNIIKFARAKGEKGKELKKKLYKSLMKISEQVMKNVKYAKSACTKKINATVDLMERINLESLKTEIDYWKTMLKKVLTQTQERILKGNKYYKEKIVSIFEPHSVGIKKGKAGKPIEFGRKISITEVENKIISHYKVLVGNPNDGDTLLDVIDDHIEYFEKAPDSVAYDRGAWKTNMEEQLNEKGVKRVSIPAKGKKNEQRKQYEKQKWFKQLQKFRAGSEGKISNLKRSHQLGRCLYKGKEGMEQWIGLGVIACNLLSIARQTT